ncbi:MAG: multiprotein bridging factor aMBF1 [Ignisphaera sp.]|uniref:TIGR00270 family protein n=1 Tax=Ignisphaera aggregans TaxID=334771 RepID=A0A7C4NU87_9CREN
MCGEPIELGKGRRIRIDSAELTVCAACASRFSPRNLSQKSQQLQPYSRSLPQSTRPRSPTATSAKYLEGGKKTSTPKPRGPSRAVVSEKLELVEDFAERIRRAREAFGWDQKALALKLKVSENIIKRIESGRLRPPNDLAKKLEEVLNIKLLVPAIEDMIESKGKADKYVTLGEIVSIRGVEEDK